MIDLVLFAGRIILVVVLYVFLFAAMRTGIGLVRGQRTDSAIWSVDIEKGTRSLRGLHVEILGPVVVGSLALVGHRRRRAVRLGHSCALHHPRARPRPRGPQVHERDHGSMVTPSTNPSR